MADARPNRKVLALSLLGLCAFLAWQALAIRSYVKIDTRPPAWDQAVHLEIALDYRHALAQGRWQDIAHLAPKPGMPPFPPLYHLALAKLYDPAQPASSALWLNWFYLAALAICLFGISYYFRPDGTALLAAVIFCCAPAVQELVYTQLIDLSVVACSAAAFWVLLLSEEFRSWAFSLAFGALFAVGMMHKWSFFSYMLPAYFLWFKALGDRRSRWQAAAAAAVALAGFGPWYAVHLAVLVPRLVGAASDAAVPVWQGGAFFTYLFQMGDGLGPALWVLGLIGLLTAHYRRRSERGWLVVAWVVGSYVFWAVVPNRQLRFLLPGLPGLAVVCAAAWPDALLWAVAAFQVVTALNFTAGWIAPVSVSLPMASVTLFPSQPPRAQDWQIDSILADAAKRAPPAQPVDNLTLVANAPRFNGPTFTYELKRLGLPGLHIRGVNKRLCEFSEFVVLKGGSLGPPSVIGGLPEAAAAIQEKGGWFSKGYENVGSFELPDGSSATLFQRRHLTAPPFRSRKTRYQFYDNGSLQAQDLRVDLGPWDPASGTYPLARIAAGQLKLRGLKVDHAAVELEGLSLVSAAKPPAAEWDDVRLLKLKRLKVDSLSVDAADLKNLLEHRVHGLTVQSLRVDQTLKVQALYGTLSLTLELRPELQAQPAALLLHLVDARVGVTPLPSMLTSAFQTIPVSFEPNPETPFEIELSSLTLRDNRITVP